MFWYKSIIEITQNKLYTYIIYKYASIIQLKVCTLYPVTFGLSGVPKNGPKNPSKCSPQVANLCRWQAGKGLVFMSRAANFLHSHRSGIRKATLGPKATLEKKCHMWQPAERGKPPPKALKNITLEWHTESHITEKNIIRKMMNNVQKIYIT